MKLIQSIQYFFAVLFSLIAPKVYLIKVSIYCEVAIDIRKYTQL